MQKNDHIEQTEYRKSALLDTLEQILSMKPKIKIISDMAFEAVDDDDSGQLDKNELGLVLRNVAKEMKIHPPTDNDIFAVLSELD